MESGGDFWKDCYDEFGEWIIGLLCDFKSGGYYLFFVKKVNLNLVLFFFFCLFVGYCLMYSVVLVEEIVFCIW